MTTRIEFQTDAIYGFRRAASMNQKEFAHYVGLSPAEISRLENGEVRPQLGTLARLCDSLGVALHALS